MNSQRAARLVLLSASIVLFSQAVYAQTKAYALVPASSVTPGHLRPYIWFAPNIANAVHDPGQTSCNSGNPCYLTPTDILNGYATNFIANGNGGCGITIGIVDAYYNNQTAADLAAYSAYYGITSTGCTTTTGTLTIVSQTGGAPTAVFNEGWAQETDLDVQMVHALAPNANILLVTATNSSTANLLAAVTYAVANSNVVSNSYGGAEVAGQTSGDAPYHSTVPVLFSSGDTGGVTEYPCTDPYVTCVGGTNLLETATGFRSVESAWSGSGGGCSSHVASPAYQSGYSTTDCPTSRGVPDVAALADPYTGVVNYWGSNIGASYSGAGVYCCIGGTSLATPLTAALIANIDTARVANAKANLGPNLVSLIYAAAASPFYRYRFYDVTTGTAGSFAAGLGWDQTTGLGVPLSPSLASYLVNIVP